MLTGVDVLVDPDDGAEDEEGGGAAAEVVSVLVGVRGASAMSAVHSMRAAARFWQLR